MSVTLSVRNLSHSYQDKNVLSNVSFDVPAGSLTALVGPSGAGKSTLLQLVASLLALNSGEVLFDGTPCGTRRAVLVFQEGILFPHMSVLENVTFALRAQKMPLGERNRKVEPLLERLGIAELSNRWPNELSAGQRQRVALARALAAQPDVLLLDEPFSNLDFELRRSAAAFLSELQKERRLTTILVTHGQEEAFQIADRLAYLREGCLIQEGTPEDFRTNPADLTTARFFSQVNEVIDPESGQTRYFRSTDTNWSIDPRGNTTIEESSWNGSGFRIRALWHGQSIALFSTSIPPAIATRVELNPQFLEWRKS